MDEQQSTEIPLKCPRCPLNDRTPRNLEQLMEHIARAHLDIRFFSCPKCNLGFVTQPLFNEHLRYVCNVTDFLKVPEFTHNILSINPDTLRQLYRIPQEAMALAFSSR